MTLNKSFNISLLKTLRNISELDQFRYLQKVQLLGIINPKQKNFRRVFAQVTQHYHFWELKQKDQRCLSHKNFQIYKNGHAMIARHSSNSKAKTGQPLTDKLLVSLWKFVMIRISVRLQRLSLVLPKICTSLFL